MTGRAVLTAIHVNRNVLKSNRLHGRNDPPITFKRKSGGRSTKTHCAIVVDDEGNELCRVVHDQKHPLPCSAVCWVETRQHVVAIEELEEEDRCQASNNHKHS